MMMKPYTILHISDFHKDKDQRFDNLLSSLKTDVENYVSEAVPKPSIIVVSGDLVQGVKETDAQARIELRKQYDEVADFLNKLVEEFLDGDKRRIIIVPGNHDLFRAHTISSMCPSNKEHLEDDKKAYFNSDSIVRWNWDDLSFYHIVNPDVYKHRFEAYIEFYNSFYQSIEDRQLPDEIDEHSFIVDLEEFGITFVGFNSCNCLDHLNSSGCICPSALTSIRAEISEKYRQGRLICGVWHHHVNGLPPERNYLDYRILNSMISNHIHVGLFGHQHQSQILQEYEDFTLDKKILLISTGTLYGREKALRSGLPRQYNLITIQRTGGEEVTLSLRVREDRSVDSYDIPNWQPYIHGASGKDVFERIAYVKVPSIENQIRSAELEAKRESNYEGACRRLKATGLTNPLAMAMYDNYLGHVDANHIVSLVGDRPKNGIQYMAVLSAATEVHNKALVRILLSEKYSIYFTPLNKEIRDKAKRIL